MSQTVNLNVVDEGIPIRSLMTPPQNMIYGARFRKDMGRCGWKGISIALIIHSLDRTYRMECDREPRQY